MAADTTLIATGGTVDFGNVAGPAGLTVTAAGDTTFAGTVGSGTTLAFLTSNGGGTTLINGGSVTTTGAQTYTDSVTTSVATSLTSGSGGIGFAGSFTGPGGANDLAVAAGTGAFSVTGALTGFNNLTVNSASDVTLANAGNAIADTVRFVSATGSVDYREASAIKLGASAITGSARIVSGDGGITVTGAVGANGGIALVAHDGVTGGNTGTITVNAPITTVGGQVTLNAADDITVNALIATNNGNVDIVAGNSTGVDYAAVGALTGTTAADEAGTGDNFGAVHFQQGVNAGTGHIVIVTAGDASASASANNVTQSATGSLISGNLSVVTLKGPGGIGSGAGANIVLNTSANNDNATVRFFACESAGCPTPILTGPTVPVLYSAANEYAAGQISYSGVGGVNLSGLGTVGDFYAFVNGPFTLTANPFSAGNVTIESDDDIIIDLAQSLLSISNNPANSLTFIAKRDILYVNPSYGAAGGGFTIGTPTTPFNEPPQHDGGAQHPAGELALPEHAEPDAGRQRDDQYAVPGPGDAECRRIRATSPCRATTPSAPAATSTSAASTSACWAATPAARCSR